MWRQRSSKACILTGPPFGEAIGWTRVGPSVFLARNCVKSSLASNLQVRMRFSLRAALLCVLAATLNTAAAYQLTSRGGSRRDVLKAFAATAPLFAAANSASAGTVGAAPVSSRFRTWDPPMYNRLIPRSHRACQTPEDEAKFDAIFAQKLEEKKVMFAKMGYEVEEEDKKEVRPCRCHPCTTTDPCLHVHGLGERRARCVCGSSSTCCGRACAASRQSSSAKGRANRPSRGSGGWCTT